MKIGIIQQSLSGFYDIIADEKIYRTRARGNFRQRKIKSVVGDHVELSAENQQEGYLLEILPRRNQSVRPSIVNVDMAAVVTSAKEPAFSANLLDRQLIALEAQDVTPLIYSSRTDLLTGDEYQQLLPMIGGCRKIGYHAYAVRKLFNLNQLVSLMEELKGNIVTMMGQTGAGKSTLLNHLAPQLKLATGETSRVLQRGRHTTRKVSLLDANGVLIADIPGFSLHETFDMTVNDLLHLSPEMAKISADCKFWGYLHIKEPQCAVKETVNNGITMRSRYDDYLQFHELIVNQKPDHKK